MDYPRWLYQDNDLSRGVIVNDDAEADDAKAKGFSEYGEDKPEPAKPKRKKAAE